MSIRDTVPATLLVIHTAPYPTATPVGAARTGIDARTAALRSEITPRLFGAIRVVEAPPDPTAMSRAEARMSNVFAAASSFRDWDHGPVGGRSAWVTPSSV
jgi:hypothetical protein